MAIEPIKLTPDEIASAAPDRVRDQERLRACFYAAFDRSRLEHILTLKDSELDRSHERIGEGSHFTAWRLKNQHRSVGVRGLQAADLGLVIKRPHIGFGDLSSPLGQAWVHNLNKLKAAAGLLIPPFEWLPGGGAGGLVMPFGDSPLGAAASHWQPIAERWRELHSALAKCGLRLAGVDQGRSWQGIPFVIDLSDLSGKR